MDAGVAALAVARELASAPAEIRVIERQYNLFLLPIAWLSGAVHIYAVTGFRNRVAVFLNWVWAWLT